MIALYDYEKSLDKKIKFERMQAREEARKEEKEEANRESAKNFYEMGIGIDQIAKGLGYTADTVKKWLGSQPT